MRLTVGCFRFFPHVFYAQLRYPLGVKNSFASALLQVLALLTGLAVASVWRDRHNILANYPEFHSAKTDLGLGVIGAQSYLHTPVALANGALNLGAWWGHQELELQRDWAHAPEISFRVRGEEASEVEIGFRSGTWKKYLRLSNRPSRPSAWLDVAPDGSFTMVSPVRYRLPKGKWTKVMLVPGGGHYTAVVEGEKLSPDVSVPAAGPLRILFRGDSTSSNLRVADVRLADGDVVYEQKFSGEIPWALFLLTITASSLAFFALQLLTSARTAAILAGVGFLLLCCSLAFYRGSLAYRYPSEVDLAGLPSHIESREEALARLKALPREGKPVLLWLGGSQAWGAGASEASKTAFSLLRAERELKNRKGTREWINGAVSGAKLKDQKEVFDLVRSRRTVGAVVLIAGVNDGDNPLFQDQLTAFAKSVREAGAVLLLVPEPTEPEPATVIASRQADAVAVGKKERIAVAELQSLFQKHDDDGFLWWDFVHLSDAGAKLEAKGLHDILTAIDPYPDL
jgi:hypothetical protein